MYYIFIFIHHHTNDSIHRKRKEKQKKKKNEKHNIDQLFKHMAQVESKQDIMSDHIYDNMCQKTVNYW